MRYIKRGIAMVVAFTMVLAWSVSTLAAGDANDNLVAANAGATQAEVDSALTILRYAQAGLTEKEESNLTVVIIVAVAAVIILGIVAAVFVTLFGGKKKKEAAASPRSTYPGGAPICQFHGFYPKPGHRKTGGVKIYAGISDVYGGVTNNLSSGSERIGQKTARADTRIGISPIQIRLRQHTIKKLRCGLTISALQ